MKNIFFILPLLVMNVAYSQAPSFEWVIKNGGNDIEQGQSITTDSKNNVISMGLFKDTTDFDPGSGVEERVSVGQYDIFIQKLDASGNLVWVHTFGSSSYDYGWYVSTDNEDNVLVTGRFEDTIDFDPSGNTLNLNGGSFGNTFIAKYSANGSLLFAKSFYGEGSNTGTSINSDDEGNIYCSGVFTGTVDFDPSANVYEETANGNDSDAYIAKFDGSGSFIWVKVFGNNETCQVRETVVDQNGDLVSVGNFHNTVDFDPNGGVLNLTSAGNSDNFVQKLDSDGNLIWAVSYGGNSLDEAMAITTAENGDIYTGGQFLGTADFDPGTASENISANGGSYLFIQKLTSNGDYLWAHGCGDPNAGTSIVDELSVDAWGNVYAVGDGQGTFDVDPGANSTLWSSNGGSDGFLAQYSSQGEYLWSANIGSTSFDGANSIAIDSEQYLYCTGSFQGTTDFDPSSGSFTMTPDHSVDSYILKLKPLYASNQEVNGGRSGLSVYPNPLMNGELLTIEIPKEEDISEIVILDIQGKEVSSFFISQKETISCSLRNGIYFVSFMNNNGIKKTQKLIVHD